MAVPSSSTAGQESEELNEDDLSVIFEALHPIAGKYLVFGIRIKVKMNEIEKIQEQCNNNPNECLLKILSFRLKQLPALTWDDIDKALRSGVVGEVRLADRIKKEYGHQFSPDPSIVVEESHGQLKLEGSDRKRKSPEKEYRRKIKRRRRERQESSSSSSESGDSSPECDMMRNISESETKELRKVFRCFFGKLCREIKDPVEMAAELQKKRLLSQSKMKEIFTSLQSRQEKVVILVTALQKKIKSRSDRIFKIIEYFLHMELLGQEMWLEIGKFNCYVIVKIPSIFKGKVCPERAAFMFGTALPPAEGKLTTESKLTTEGELTTQAESFQGKTKEKFDKCAMIGTISLIHCISFMKHKKIVIQSSMFSLEAAQRMNMFEFPLAKS